MSARLRPRVFLVEGQLVVHRLHASQTMRHRYQQALHDRVLAVDQARRGTGLLARERTGGRGDGATRLRATGRRGGDGDLRLAVHAPGLARGVPGAKVGELAGNGDVDAWPDRAL